MSARDPSLPADVLLEHQDFLRALARGLLGDPARADDAVQEAYAAALESPPRLADGASARSWLAVVVRNHARNLLRGDARRADRERLVARAESVEDDALERLRVQRRVLEALERLREPYRTAVFLRYAEGLPPREIARRTDSNVETVRSRVQRGLELLRRDLDHEFGDRGAWSALLLPIALARRTGSAIAIPAAAWMVAAALLVAAALAPFLLDLARGSGGARIAALPRVAPWIAARALDAPPGRATRAPASADATLAPPRPADPAGITPGSVAVRVADAGGRALAGVRVGDSEPTDGSGWTSASSTERRAFDGASGAEFAVLARSIDADGAVELVLDVPAEFELDADPADLAGATLRLGGEGGAVAAESRAHLGARPFVRFARAPARTLLERDGGSSWTLSALGADALRRADRRVHAVRGLATEPVRLDFADAARLELRFTSASGADLRDVRVALDPRAGESASSGDPASTPDFACAGLAPGAHALVVAARGHAPRRIELELPAGTTRRDIALEARAEFAVEFASTGTRPGQAGEIELRRAGDPLDPRTLRVPQGAPVVAHLPAGTWTAVPRGDGPWPFDPPRAEFAVPGPGPRFVRQDAEEPLDVRVRARDERGRRIERVRVALLVDRYGLGKRAAFAADPRIVAVELDRDGRLPAAVLAGQDFHWLVEADGRASSYGAARDARRSGDHVEIDVLLAPAWRAEFWCAGPDARGVVRPIEGARLATIRGRELGRSLADGRIVLELPYDPGQLALELEGWRTAAWEGFANGRRRAELPVHRVLLERER